MDSLPSERLLHVFSRALPALGLSTSDLVPAGAAAAAVELSPLQQLLRRSGELLSKSYSDAAYFHSKLVRAADGTWLADAADEAVITPALGALGARQAASGGAAPWRFDTHTTA